MGEKSARAYFKGNKIGFVVLGGAIGIIAILFLIARARTQAPPSSLGAPPRIDAVAGQAGTPRYNGDVTLANARAASQALANGQTSFPVPVGTASNAFSAAPIKPGLQLVPSRESSEPQASRAAAVSVTMPQNAVPAPPAQLTMQTAPQPYSQEVKSILGAIAPVAPGPVAVAQVEQTQSTQQGGVASRHEERAAPTPLTGAHIGTIVYGLARTAADSDSPGPVLVTVPAGKLQGAQVVGHFQREGHYLVVRFTGMHWAGTDWTIDAIAVDPQTSLPAVRTSVDTHWLSRYSSLLGGAFLSALQGYGQAVAQSGQTTVQSVGNSATITTNPQLSSRQQLIIAGATAAGTVAQTVGQSVQQGWNQPPTVKIAPDQGMGILFLGSPHPDSGSASVTGSGARATQDAAASQPAAAAASRIVSVAPIRVGAPLGATNFGSTQTQAAAP